MKTINAAQNVQVEPCPHLVDDTCYVTSHPTEPSPEICMACTRLGRGINEVTVLHTIETLMHSGEEVPQYLTDYIKNPDLSHGPGTSLKNFLSWFITQPPNCSCNDRAKLMNLWGKKKCLEEFSTIMGWLRESALDSGIRYSEIVLSYSVKTIIRMSK